MLNFYDFIQVFVFTTNHHHDKAAHVSNIYVYMYVCMLQNFSISVVGNYTFLFTESLRPQCLFKEQILNYH